MKTKILVFSAVLAFASCNQRAKVEEDKNSTSTAMPYIYNENVDSLELAEEKPVTPAPASKPKPTRKESTASTSGSASNAGGGTTASSEGTNDAKKKSGWSKTAKGAVIGGVVGAGTGAAVNKKNRAAGAVVGGVIGAGAGAVIGHEMDKKDGRH